MARRAGKISHKKRAVCGKEGAEDEVDHAQWRDEPNWVMDTRFADAYAIGGLGRRDS